MHGIQRHLVQVPVAAILAMGANGRLYAGFTRTTGLGAIFLDKAPDSAMMAQIHFLLAVCRATVIPA